MLQSAGTWEGHTPPGCAHTRRASFCCAAIVSALQLLDHAKDKTQDKRVNEERVRSSIATFEVLNFALSLLKL